METKENVDLAQDAKLENQEAATNQAVSADIDNNEAENKGDDFGTHQEHIKEALELLYTHFPKAFIKEGDCKPLKVGILDDLKERVPSIEGLSISKVRAAVRIYTTRLRYLYSVREGVKRVDLDGVEGESVTAEHAEYARTRFSEINAKRRPAKAKKPNNRPFNKNRRPFNKGGNNEGNNNQNKFNKRPFQNRGRFNNNNNNGYQNNNYRNNDRRLEPAKASDIRVGRYVFVSTDRSYVKGTVSEELHGDNVSVTLQNGLPVNIPLNRVFISNNQNRPNRPFNRNNNHNGPRHYDKNNRGDRNFYQNKQKTPNA